MEMIEDLLALNWEELFSGRSLDECYTIFAEIFHSMCLKYVPVVRDQCKSRPPWFTSEIRSLIKEKHKLWYKFKSSKSAVVKNEY